MKKAMLFLLILTIGSALFAQQTYRIGDHGPAGGIVFYDKGHYSNNWRYLEVAQTDFGVNIDYNTAWNSVWNLTINGVSGWVIPDIYELELIYNNLKNNGWGNFGNNWYWSSNSDKFKGIWVMSFGNGRIFMVQDNARYNARAIRRF